MPQKPTPRKSGWVYIYDAVLRFQASRPIVVVYHIKGIDSIFTSALSRLVVLSVTVPSSVMALMTERRNEESIKNKNHMI
jgi:hypothetical protein